MPSKGLKVDRSGQLRPVLLLLAIAVVLPTVCLLWFMSQAVKNERIAVRQKLIGIYQEKLSEAAEKSDKDLKEELERLDEQIGNKEVFRALDDLRDVFHYDGVIIYDETGRRVYPRLVADVDRAVELTEIFKDVWQLEFVEQDYARAAELYGQKAQSINIYVKFAALIGKSRCLAKLGKVSEAISACREVAYSSEEKYCDTSTLMLIANARLLLIELSLRSIKSNESLALDGFLKLREIIEQEDEAGSFLPCDQRIFLARKILEVYEKSSFLKEHVKDINVQSLQKEIAFEELSVRMAGRFPAAFALADWPDETLRSIGEDGETICGLRHDVSGKTLLLLCREKVIRSL